MGGEEGRKASGLVDANGFTRMGVDEKEVGRGGVGIKVGMATDGGESGSRVLAGGY